MTAAALATAALQHMDLVWQAGLELMLPIPYKVTCIFTAMLNLQRPLDHTNPQMSTDYDE